MKQEKIFTQLKKLLEFKNLEETAAALHVSYRFAVNLNSAKQGYKNQRNFFAIIAAFMEEFSVEDRKALLKKVDFIPFPRPGTEVEKIQLLRQSRQKPLMKLKNLFLFGNLKDLAQAFHINYKSASHLNNMRVCNFNLRNAIEVLIVFTEALNSYVRPKVILEKVDFFD